MGLRNSALLLLVTLLMASCASVRDVGPADRDAHNQTWRYDCCDPGLSEGTKWMCDWAAKKPDHVLKDTDGNHYEYIWSDCKVGEEPWQKFN